jgi:hypothetical protein
MYVCSPGLVLADPVIFVIKVCRYLFYTQAWAQRYISLLWLSITCMNPFAMAAFDAQGMLHPMGGDRV